MSVKLGRTLKYAFETESAIIETPIQTEGSKVFKVRKLRECVRRSCF